MEPHDIEAKAFPIGRRGYEKEAVDAYLHEVAAAFRTLREQATESPPAAGTPSFENVGSQVSAILATAAAAADEMTAAAEKEAEAVRAAATQETEAARQALAEHLANSEQLTAAAEEEAASLVAAARDEAARIQQEALATAEGVERQARERANALERTTVGNVETMLANGTKQYERLRDVRDKAADRLATVEALIRKAREECSDELARDAFQEARQAVKGAKGSKGNQATAAQARAAGGDGSGTRVAANRRAPSPVVKSTTARARARQG